MNDTADHTVIIDPRFAACVCWQQSENPGKLLIAEPKTIT